MDLPDPGIEPGSALQAGTLPTELTDMDTKGKIIKSLKNRTQSYLDGAIIPTKVLQIFYHLYWHNFSNIYEKKS